MDVVHSMRRMDTATSNRVIYPIHPKLSAGGVTAWTVAIWYTVDATGVFGFAYQLNGSAGTKLWQIFQRTSDIRLRVDDSVGGAPALIDLPDSYYTPAGIVHSHISTFDAGTVSVYADGTFYSSAGVGGTLGTFDDSTEWLIGNDASYTLSWKGLLGPHCMYDRALSPSAVKALHHYGPDGLAVTRGFRPVAHLDLGERDGTKNRVTGESYISTNGTWAFDKRGPRFRIPRAYSLDSLKSLGGVTNLAWKLAAARPSLAGAGGLAG